MGIRFLCPAGHALHVKDFLAGRRGICPQCGKRFIVPASSQAGQRVSEAPDVARSARPRTSRDEPQPAAFAQPSVSTAEAPSAASAASSKGLGSAGGTRLPHGEGAPHRGRSAAPVAADTSAPPAGGSTQTPRVDDPFADLDIDRALSTGAGGHAAGGDPLAENPSAVWYVQLSGGQQYGPANGPLMQRWLAEGRIGADSIVWREGWLEWRPAAEVFPERAVGGTGYSGASFSREAAAAYSGRSAEADGGASRRGTAAVAVDETTPSSPPRARGQRPSRWIVVALVVAAVALVPVLYWVLTRQGQ